MKKLKFLTLAAIAAATAMVSSCSDNGDLSTPTKEAEGKALVVNPTVLDSRVTPLAKSDFKGFKLYGVQNPTNGESVGSFIKTGTTSGVNYAGTFGSSDAEVSFAPASGTVKWPTTNPDNSANFYGISVQGEADLAESGITVTEDGITDGTFSYSAPMSGGYVDLRKQKDIMIASSLDAKQTDNNGVVTLPFKHAFAKLTLQLRWNTNEWIDNGNTNTGIDPNSMLVIDYIKIHNIKCSGTYSFTADDGNGGKGKWTVDEGNSTIMYQFATPVRFSSGEDEATASNPYVVRDLIVGNDALMIIPQELGLWTKDGSLYSENTSAAFVEVRCCAYSTDGVSEEEIKNVNFWDEEGGDLFPALISDEDNAEGKYMASVYIPIRISEKLDTEPVTYNYHPFVIEQNKSYNFRINMVTCRKDNGDNAIQGVVVQD